MNAFDSLLRFERDQLFAGGNVFTLLPYESSLHEELSFHLQDPPLALQISRAFEKHIEPRLRGNEREAFVKALISIVMIFSKKALVKALVENGLNWESSALDAFVEAAQPQKPEQQSHTTFRICILTTTAAGGNASVTRAVQLWLETFSNVETRVIDVEAVAKKYDAFKIATGLYTFDGLYETFFQKQSAGDDFLIVRNKANRDLARFVPSRTLEKLKKKVGKFSPDLLITTRNYKQDDLSIGSSLRIPTRMLYCDYDINIYHLPLIGKADPQQLNFWFPSLGPEGFKSLFAHYEAGDRYNPADNWDETARKIADFTRSSHAEIQESFKEVLFPVGPEFSPVVDQEKLERLKQKWELPPGYSAVMITMGKNGVQTLEEIFQMLADTKVERIKYYFICGTNDKLEKQFKEAALKHCQILGFLNYQEMGELMAISSLIISKPGGSTAGECQAMGLPMLVMYAHGLWEGGNERQLQKLGLAFKRRPELRLDEQIVECLKQPRTGPPQAGWKEKLQGILKL